MTDFPETRLFYLTDPEKDVWVVNLQTEEGQLTRAKVSFDQLRHFAREAVYVLLGRRA